jgi:hypothetical protein
MRPEVAGAEILIGSECPETDDKHAEKAAGGYKFQCACVRGTEFYEGRLQGEEKCGQKHPERLHEGKI